MSRALGSWLVIVTCACGAAPRSNASDPTSASLGTTNEEAPPPERSSLAQAHERACSLGLASGCNDWGVALLDGKGVPKDEERAAGVLKKACELGSAWGCFNWAFVQESGASVQKDVASAAKDYEKSCGGGVAHGCNRLGLLLSEAEFERELPAAPKRAVELFEKACELGLPIACGNAGSLLPSVLPSERARAADLLKRGCDGDVATACAQYAERVASGDGESQDPKRAVVLFERACKLEPAVGCYFWGFALLNEDSGLSVDFARGQELIARACKAGNPDACSALEELHEE